MWWFLGGGEPWGSGGERGLFTFLFHLEMISVVQARGDVSLVPCGLKLGIGTLCEGCKRSRVLVRFV